MLPLAMLQLTSIPLTFVLGFYVSLIVTRWGWLDVRILSLIILVGRPVDSDLLGGGTSTVSFPGQTRWQYTPWGSLSERSLSSYLSLFQSIYPDPGGAPEVDEAEHCEVQPALLLHVHEDRQLQGEEEVSRPSGISHSTAKRPSYLNWYLIGSTSLMPDWWGMMNWKCFRTWTPRFFCQDDDWYLQSSSSECMMEISGECKQVVPASGLGDRHLCSSIGGGSHKATG